MSASVGAPARRARLLGLIQARGAIVVLALALLAASLAFPHFASRANLVNVLTASSFLGLVAIGQSFVIILGGFDLSVGSLVGLGSVLAAYAQPYGWAAGFGAPVLAGLAVGLVDGLLIARARMAPFIVTLAALLGVKGVALVLAGQSMQIVSPGVFGAVANTAVLGMPLLAWLLLAAFALAALVLNRTRFGAAVFAVGGSEEAARMLGIRVARVKVATYCLSGALAGLSGALLAAHLDSGIPTAGTGYELRSIAAAVIGGVLLTGGVGTLSGALCGVLLLGLIENVINQIGTLSAYYQDLASGVFLLIAVVAQTALGRRRSL